MESVVEPYTYHLIVWLITLLLAVCFGFLIGLIVGERRLTNPKPTPTRPRL